MADIIWKAYENNTSWGNDVNIKLPDQSIIYVCGSLISARAKKILEKLDSKTRTIDISDCDVSSDALRSVMDHVHGSLECDPPRRDLPRDLDNLIQILHAANYCDAQGCKQWVEHILMETYIPRCSDANLCRIFEAASFRHSEKLFIFSAKEIASRTNPQEILKGIDNELLEKFHQATKPKRAQGKPGATVASGHEDGQIRFWDCGTGECLRILKTTPDHSTQKKAAVLALHFSPDGTLIISAQDNLCQLWDIESGSCIRVLDGGHTKIITSCVFSPDGALVATGAQDNNAILWPIVTPASSRTLAGHTQSVNSVAFSHDGAMLATASSDHSVLLWTTVTGTCLRVLSIAQNKIGHAAAVNCVAFSPNSCLLCSCSDDCTAKVWNAESGELVRSIRGEFGQIRCAIFSPYSASLALASANRTISLYEPQSGLFRKHLQGHSDAVNAIVYSLDNTSGDDPVLVSASDDCTCRVWDPLNGNCLHTLEDPHTSLVFNLVKALSFRPPLSV